MNKQGRGKIEYLDFTYNPISGCLHPCKDQYCYAKKIAYRFGGHLALDGFYAKTIGKLRTLKTENGDIAELDEPLTLNGHIAPFPFGFEPTFHRYRLDELQKVKKPSVIGVVYMGDLFGDWVPDEWINEVFQACFETPQHTYVFLTKNPKRYDRAIDIFANEERSYGLNEGYWNNVWFGTTITCQEDAKRIPELLKFPEGHKFISVEPLLGEIDLTGIPGLHFPGCTTHDVLSGKLIHLDDDGKWTSDNKLDWVIVGSQTGPGAKPPKDEWVQSIIGQCREAGVPIFVKSPLYERFPIQEWPKGLRR